MPSDNEREAAPEKIDVIGKSPYVSVLPSGLYTVCSLDKTRAGQKDSSASHLTLYVMMI